MPGYRVTLTGGSREVYYVEADSAEEAREKWADGDLLIQESSGMAVDSVEEEDE